MIFIFQKQNCFQNQVFIIKYILFNLLFDRWPILTIQCSSKKKKKRFPIRQTAKLKISLKTCLKAHFLSYLLYNVFNVLDLGNNTQQSGKTETATLITPLAYLRVNRVLMHEQNTSRSSSWSSSRLSFSLNSKLWCFLIPER